MKRFIIISLVAFFTNSVSTFADFGGGTGEPNNPYLIYTAEQLNSIYYELYLSKCFKLMADIDLSEYNPFDPNNPRQFNIIGNLSYPFTGEFDGNWHTISNFTYYNSNRSYAGIFGYVKGRIKNLGIISTEIYASNYIGALAGFLDGELICCWSDGGSIHGSSYTGGLVGCVGSSTRGGNIVNCWSSVAVNGQIHSGGLAGRLEGLAGEEQYTNMMINCYASGNVTGTNGVGGLVGGDAAPYVSLYYNCYSSGHVSGSNAVGGFVGAMINFSNISGCFWDTEASGTIDGVGTMDPDPIGISGKTTAQMQTQSTFTNSSWDFAGELNNGPGDDWAMPAGGGYPVMWYNLSPWPALPSFTAGSGTAEDPYQILTDLEMRSIGHNSRLMDKHFILAADVTMSDVNFPMIGNDIYPFTGSFNGNNRTVSNVKCRGGLLDNYVGFFSIAGDESGTGAEIANLNLANVDVNGGTVPTGALAGQVYFGEMKNCHIKDGNISGYEYVGGLIGKALGCDVSKCSTKGIYITGLGYIGGLIGKTGPLFSIGEITFIRECSSNCSIRGSAGIGGLVGYLKLAEVYDSYSKGDINTEYGAGGFLGINYGSLYRCYSSSLVTGGGTKGGFIGSAWSDEHCEGCFWDVNVNPGLPGAGGYSDPNLTGETTEHMQMQSTFTDAGWDYVNETTNGLMDIWYQPINSYPKLYWEAMAGDANYDETVNIDDLDLLCFWWLIQQSDLPADERLLCDFNFDAILNFQDFGSLAGNWLNGTN
jgi:hypothetical protein